MHNIRCVCRMYKIRLMMSMVVAEITAALGLVCVQGSETRDWGNLFALSMNDLQKMARPSQPYNTVTVNNANSSSVNKSSNSNDKPTH